MFFLARSALKAADAVRQVKKDCATAIQSWQASTIHQLIIDEKGGIHNRGDT
jgi:hypothetical protein